MDKPNCYECTHRRDVPGSAHSKCGHPKAGSDDAWGNIMGIFASVGRSGPVANIPAAEELEIAADPTGIASGWFNWPWNFDPVWLKNCKGYEAKIPEEVGDVDKT